MMTPLGRARILVAALTLLACAGREKPRATQPQQTTPAPLAASDTRTALAEPVVSPSSAGSLQRSKARQLIQRAARARLGGSLGLSKDGYAAVWTDDDMLRIWHLPSGMLVRVLSEAQIEGSNFAKPVHPVWDAETREVLFASGSDVVAVGIDGTVRRRPWPGGVDIVRVRGAGPGRWLTHSYGAVKLLDKSHAVLAEARAKGSLEKLAVSGNGRVGAALSGVGLQVFGLAPLDTSPRVVALPQKPSYGDDLSISEDGDTALACIAGKPNALYRIENLTSPTPNVSAVALDSSTTECLSVFTGKDTAMVSTGKDLVGLDVRSATIRWRTPSPSLAAAMEAADDGRHVTVLRFDGSVSVYDARGGAAIGELGAAVVAPQRAHFLPTGELIGTGSDVRPFEAAVWSMTDGRRVRRMPVNWGSYMLDASGTVHAGYSDITAGHAPCAKNERGEWFVKLSASSGPAGVRPNGLASRGRETAKRIWPPTDTQAAIACIGDSLRVVATNPRVGRLITMTNRPKPVVEVRDVVGRSRVLADVPTGGICGLNAWLSRTGSHVFASPCAMGAWSTLHVWDAATGAKIGKLTADPADKEQITFGPNAPPRAGFWTEDTSDDGQVVAVASGRAVTVYSLPARKPLHTLRLPTDVGWATAVAFAPRSRDRIVVGTSLGELFSSEKGALLGRGDSPGGAIKSISSRADGARIATVSDDGAIRTWDARAQLIATLVDFTDDEWVTTTPRGAYVGTAEAAERVGWVFDTPTEGFRFEQFAKTFNRPEVVARRVGSGAGDAAEEVQRPPSVSMSAVPASESATGSAAFKAHVAASVDRRVASLHVFVEGRPVKTIDVGFSEADVSAEVELLAGNNVVTLIAFDDAGLGSNPVAFEVKTSKPRTRPDIWVVAIGVGRYPKLAPEQQLEATTNDAQGIAAAFADQAGPGKAYESAHVTVLLDDKVTPGSVSSSLNALSAMRPEDVAVVFFAGHGVKLAGGEMVFLTGSASLLAAEAAAAGIGWSTIGSALAGAKGRVLVLLDACHSGHVSQDLVVPNEALANELAKGQRAGTFVFAASKGRQESLEADTSRGVTLVDDKKTLVAAPPTLAKDDAAKGPHGYFTGAFLQALRSPNTDANGNGVVELSEIVSQVTLRVSRASSGRQTPWVVRRELFGDFAIGRAR